MQRRNFKQPPRSLKQTLHNVVKQYFLQWKQNINYLVTDEKINHLREKKNDSFIILKRVEIYFGRLLYKVYGLGKTGSLVGKKK